MIANRARNCFLQWQ